MPITTVALALPFVYWTLLMALASGTFAFVAITGRWSDATRGYLAFGGVLSALLALLTLAVDLGLVLAPGIVVRSAPAELDAARRLALVTLVFATLAYSLLRARPHARDAAGLVGAASAAIALGTGALGWAPSAVDAVPLGLQLGLVSLATGGALAALVLGHWYLVTPRVSERPLLLQSSLLAGVLGLQLAVSVVWALFGGGPQQQPFEAQTGSAALLGWLRLGVTVLFPLVLVVMARATARTRSMESATGLLYVAVAAVMAGTIGAATLYATEGLLL